MSIQDLGSTLAKIIAPLLTITAVVVVHRRRRLSLAECLGLNRPPVGASIAWLLLYAAVTLGSDYFVNWRGPWDFSGWRSAPLWVDILRVLAVVILGPIAEELIFRGVIYRRLALTRIGAPGAIGLTALVWGGIHFGYTSGVIALLIFAGLLLGLARWQTRSVVTPMLMHIAWNLYAIW